MDVTILNYAQIRLHDLKAKKMLYSGKLQAVAKKIHQHAPHASLLTFQVPALQGRQI